MQFQNHASSEAEDSHPKSARNKHPSEPFHNRKRAVFRKVELLVKNFACDCFVMIHNRTDDKIFTYTNDDKNFNLDRVCQLILKDITGKTDLAKNKKFKNVDLR